MSIDIRLKHSATANKAPQPADLKDGELALNTNAASPAAYIKDSAGNIVKLAGAGAIGGTDATTTAKGIVQLADATAITAGTAGLIVDAAQLKAAVPPDATETVKGIAEIATTAEVNAGTDDQRIVTPLKLQAYVTDQLKATWLPGDHIGASDIGTSTWNGPADTLAASGYVEVKIAAGAWGAGGAVAPGDQVQVRWLATGVATSPHDSALTGRVENTSGNVGVDYNVRLDKLPASITVKANPGAGASAVSESDSSTAVHGINAPARLWLASSDGTTPEVSIAGGAWTAVPATAATGLAVAAGETFKLRHTTKAGANTVTTTTVRVGWDAASSVAASYASTNAATKAPDVGTVTLADVPGGARFTSTAFPVSVTMTDDGTPTSTKKLKAYVEGTLKSAAQTSGIVSVAGNVLTLTDNTQLANFTAGDAITEVTSTGAAGDATGTVGSVDIVAKTITLATTAGTWDVGSSVKGPLKAQMVTVTPNSDVITNVAGNVLTFATAKDLAQFAAGDAVKQENSAGTPIYSTGAVTTTNGTTPAAWLNLPNLFDSSTATYAHGNPSGGPCFVILTLNPPLNVTSAVSFYGGVLPGSTTNVTIQLNNEAALPIVIGAKPDSSKTQVPFSGLLSSIRVTKPLPDNAGVYLYAFEVDGKILVDGTGIEPRGTVASVDTTAKTMTLATSNGTWGPANAGHHVIGPTKSIPVANVKLYCKLDAAGAVSDLQSADPGFTAWTPAGTGPYTGTVTFPATLPTGGPPDTEMPAGTTVTVEVQATNTAGSDSAKSNTLTPS